MSYSKLFAELEAKYAAEVMYDTWGHLDAKPGEVHKGWFTFCNGQHGDFCAIESSFPTFDEGPGYFQHREDFMWKKIQGRCSKIGVYRFDGEYSLSKRGNGKFKGKITKIL